MARAATPESRSSPEPVLGLGTASHCVPSQCSVRVWWVLPLDDQPTAQMSLAAITATAKSRLSGKPLLALGTMLQPGVQPGVGVAVRGAGVVVMQGEVYCCTSVLLVPPTA